tara:strand:- start:14731 stop:15321 length:591 start_codon:yes stop_codon:yes gene_type:complete
MYEFFFKRILDILISSLALLILLPVIILLYISVKIDSTGPFLFKQIRIGKNLKKFKIYKIRTMTKAASIDANNKNLEYITTSHNDVRITRVGKYLRKFHLDEIPQFYNVIKGDMSLIGVRPDAPTQENDYSKLFWIKRHTLKPGITGLSQIKSDINFNSYKRNKYDEFYIGCKNKFSMDLYIFIKTVVKLFRGSSF